MFSCLTFFLVITCFFCTTVHGQVQNGGFEIPDPNRATQWYTPPMYWHFQDSSRAPMNKNYVGRHSSFIPIPEHDQNNVNWTIPAPFNGEKFVLLSTGDAEGFGTEAETFNSTISQIITLCPGDTLYGNYFFGTTDYSDYEDTAFGKLFDPNLVLLPQEGITDPNSNALLDNDPIKKNLGIELFLLSVDDVESFMATHGWKNFKYQHQGESCQQFRLYFQVRDCIDRSYKSYLAVDNVRICKGTPVFGDLNLDCIIDMYDYNLLAKAWMADCNDPNISSDPNIPCDTLAQHGVTTVTEQELTELSECWLHDYNVAEDPNIPPDPNL